MRFSIFLWFTYSVIVVSTKCCIDVGEQSKEQNVECVINKFGSTLTNLLESKWRKNFAISSKSLMAAITPMLFMLKSSARHRVETCLGTSVEQLQTFMDTKCEDKGVLRMATRIWLDTEVKVNRNKTNEFVGDLFERIDMRKHSDETEQFVNSWVRNETDGMIQHLLPKGSINENTKMVITNAISFKGQFEFLLFCRGELILHYISPCLLNVCDSGHHRKLWSGFLQLKRRSLSLVVSKTGFTASI